MVLLSWECFDYILCLKTALPSIPQASHLRPSLFQAVCCGACPMALLEGVQWTPSMARVRRGRRSPESPPRMLSEANSWWSCTSALRSGTPRKGLRKFLFFFSQVCSFPKVSTMTSETQMSEHISLFMQIVPPIEQVVLMADLSLQTEVYFETSQRWEITLSNMLKI